MIIICRQTALVAGLILLAGVVFCQQKDCTPSDIPCWVNRLDTINSVYDPTVKKISEFGDTIIPFVLEKAKSKRRFTSLGAAWVFKHLKSEKAILPLLEVQQSGAPSTALTALNMVLDARKDLWGLPPLDKIDSDRAVVFQALLGWAVNGDSLPGAKKQWKFTDANLFKESHKGVVIISTEEMNADYRFILPGNEVHVLNKDQRQKWADAHSDYLYFKFRDVCFYYPPSGTKESIEAIAKLWLDMPWMKGKASQIMYLSGGGDQTFWIKRNGKWYFAAVLSSWIS